MTREAVRGDRLSEYRMGNDTGPFPVIITSDESTWGLDGRTVVKEVVDCQIHEEYSTTCVCHVYVSDTLHLAQQQ